MQSKNIFTLKTVAIFIIFFVAGLVSAFYALNSYIYNEKQADEEPKSNEELEAMQVSDLPYADSDLQTFWFKCSTGDIISISYPESADTATLVVEGDMAFELPRAISGSGARYAFDDESVSFWEHQGEVVVEYGATQLEGCVATEMPAV